MQTLFIGQNLVRLASVDSTNNYALQLLKDTQVMEGTLIWALEQTKGRGQRENNWLAEPFQNLTMSIILYPDLTVRRQFYLTKVIALGLETFVSELIGKKDAGSDIKIKWPNDIYVSDKKIAGVLIENNLRAEQIFSSVIGIGLNVNQKKFNGLSNATSLQILSNTVFDLSDCLSRLCEHIEARYLQLKANKMELLDSDYEERLYKLGELGDYEKDGKRFGAILTGVNEQGKLLLKQENGEISEYGFKEITFCGNS